MNTYEVCWQYEQGTAEWQDSFLYYAKDVHDLGNLLRAIRNDKSSDDNTDMSVIFACTCDDDDALDHRDITDDLPEDLLAD